MSKVMCNEDKIMFYILVPVYKVEKYIKNCIESVINQSYQNFRLILIDDGSPDLAGQICDKYAENDGRIHVIHQKNMGQIAARSTAVKYIQESCRLKDAYVIFLDSDDTIKLGALKRLVEVINRENCDMIVYGFDKVFGDKIVSHFDNHNKSSFVEVEKRNLYRRVFLSSEYNSVCRKAIKAELIPEKNYEKYYKYLLAEDLLQSIDFYKSASTVYFLQESLYNYSINPNSITHSVNPDNYKIDYTIRENVSDFLQSEDVFTEEDWKEYRGFCVALIIDSIKTISCFNISYGEKKQFYREIKETRFYKQSIQGRKFKSSSKIRIQSYLFEIGAYRIFEIYGCLRKVHGKIKR